MTSHGESLSSSSAGKAGSGKCLKDTAQGLVHRHCSINTSQEHQEMSFQFYNSREAADGIFHATPLGHGKLIGDRGGDVDT